MKTVFLIGWLTSLSYWATAQVFVDGVDISKEEITYCQLLTGSARATASTYAYIDYGQPSPYARRQVISGTDRQQIRFGSSMDALNFMVRNGWELVSSHINSDKDGAAERYYYLLRKRTAGSVK
ncbi:MULTISPECIES: hypothetical protein [Spirosoma]|uniref:DUF4177 domain-containing protein n=1 Tax=Spirosoma sordidisoli TaxID=2502893 RepID=A0A4Q2UTR7_9BACT|nr:MULTISPECIES: hypothetical protein [Spirosoma]RYC71170.1 hypothetical protein EQG79_03215 [Spirosoma sordidisoli]